MTSLEKGALDRGGFRPRGLLIGAFDGWPSNRGFMIGALLSYTRHRHPLLHSYCGRWYSPVGACGFLVRTTPDRPFGTSCLPVCAVRRRDPGSMILCCAMRCDAVRCRAMPCDAVRCGPMRCLVPPSVSDNRLCHNMFAATAMALTDN